MKVIGGCMYEVRKNFVEECEMANALRIIS